LLAKDVLRLDECSVWRKGSLGHAEKDELPIESLVKMALFRDSPLDQKRAKQWDLRGSVLKLNALKMFVSEDFGCIDRVMNVNAENLELKTAWMPDDSVGLSDAFSNIIVPKLSGLFVADRIKNFHMDLYAGFNVMTTVDRFLHDPLRVLAHYVLVCCYPMLEKLFGAFVANRIKNFRMVNDAAIYAQVCADNFRVLANYVLTCCPMLEKLSIDIAFDVHATDFESYAQWIKLLNEKLKNGTLSLETHACEMIITTKANFPEQTLTAAIQNEHDVTKMGEHFDSQQEADVVISRQVTLKEKFIARHILFDHY